MTIFDLKTNYRIDPIGLDDPAPAFSWKLRSDLPDTVQTACRILVAADGEPVWDTGFIETNRSVCHVYGGAPLTPMTCYEVSVSVRDNHGETASVSGWFETGLMSYKNMKADWITHPFEAELQPCAVFAKHFSLTRPVQSVRLYASALGIYEAELNGSKVGDIHFAPGWTSYKKRIQYQSYDVTEQIEGDNVIRFTVGNGWYKGTLGFEETGSFFGDRTALIAQLVIHYTDGSTEFVCTDESWLSGTGSRRYSDIYNGETVDMSFEPQPMAQAVKYEHPKDILVGHEGAFIRVTERIKPQRSFVTPKGEVVLDFGQNLSGVVEAKLQLPRGTTVTLRHAEALDENGNLFFDNLRTAKATDTYICSGRQDVFFPVFTYHGFRYAQVIGLPGEPELEAFTACVLHSDLQPTAQFHCSDERVNQLWRNIDWTMRSNYFDVPTDCPQRDERFGYTGDAQLFAPTALFLRDTALFYRKWLNDMDADSSPTEGVPMNIPAVTGGNGMSIWHEAAVIIPWELYQAYGDERFLSEHYETMRGCVEYTRSRTGSSGLLDSGYQLGDWVALDMERGPMRKPTGETLNLTPAEKTGSTDLFYIANAYYIRSIQLLLKAARVLGKTEDIVEYSALLDDVLSAYRSEYFTVTGRVLNETQTACALALQFDLAPENARKRIAETLTENVKKHNYHLTTGFVGTQQLCFALSQNGAHDTAGALFLQEDCPSWLYSVKLGATTVWELWDGVNEDGSFNKYEMNSLNQYAFAGIGNWMHRELCGIQPLEAGYRKSRIAPRLITGVEEVICSLETVYGLLSCKLECRKGVYRAQITVPANSSAVICLPEQEEITVGSGDYYFEYTTESSFAKETFGKEALLGDVLLSAGAGELFQQMLPELSADEGLFGWMKTQSFLALSAVMPTDIMKRMECFRAEVNHLMYERQQGAVG